MANKRIVDLTTQAAIVDADWLEVQVSTEAVTKKASVNVVTKVERDARKLQDDIIEAGVGLSVNGIYVPPVGSNYLDSSTYVMNALELLDAAIGSSGSAIVVDTITVSAANLNNAGIAPFQLVAAPGATKYIEVLHLSIWLNFVSAAVECGSQKLVIQYDTGASHFAEWANAWIEGAADSAAKATWTSNVTMMLNKKVELTFESGANPTAGDSTLKVWIAYIVRDTAV